MSVLFTIGYQGHDEESFFSLLGFQKIDVLVDVRDSARSRNRYFARSALQEAAGRYDVTYIHMPELGVPINRRRELAQTGDFKTYTRGYRKLLKDEQEALQRLYDLVANHTCCLLCYERKAEECHRSILAQTVVSMNGDDISVENL